MFELRRHDQRQALPAGLTDDGQDAELAAIMRPPFDNQAGADRRRYEARDDYDKAAAEEWVCRALKNGDCTQEQVASARRLKELIGQDEYPATSIHDDIRFKRHVRSHLRRLAKMTKANEGVGKTLHYQ